MASHYLVAGERVEAVCPRQPVFHQDELRAAGGLSALLLSYCGAVLLISGAPLAEVRPIVRLFFTSAADAALIMGSLVAALQLFRGATKEEVAARLCSLAGAVVATALIFPFYNLFKQQILPHRGFVWDHSFAEISRTLLFGNSGWVITHKLFPGVAATRIIDAMYAVWFVLLVLFPMVVALAFDRWNRLRLLAAWLLAWILVGTVAAWCFASAGPIYFNALVGHDRSFAELQSHLALIDRASQAEGHALTAIEVQRLLLDSLGSRSLEPGGGISAMPSMHVAMATLFAIAGFVRGPRLGTAFAAYAVVIWVGSVHLGWHYAVDGPVAVLMMWCIWKATAFIVPPGERVQLLSA